MDFYGWNRLYLRGRKSHKRRFVSSPISICEITTQHLRKFVQAIWISPLLRPPFIAQETHPPHP